MKTTTVLAATAVLSTAAAQFGDFAVINHCNFPIYLWSVAGGEAPGPMITLPANRPDIGYKETYRTTANSGGVSLKASPNFGPGNSVPMDKVTQLEYTVPSQTDPSQASVKNLIFYDLSWVNGNVFEGVSLTMQTSMGDGPTPCPWGTCGTDGTPCDIGYEWSTDDTKTHACALDQDVIWTFCSDGQGQLQSPTGLLGKRDALPEPSPAPKAGANSEGLAVCVALGGDGIAQECDEAVPVPSSSAAATSSPAPVVALQKPAVASSSSSSSTSTTPTTTPAAAPTTTPSTTPAAPTSSAVATAPAPISNGGGGGPVAIAALTNLQQSGVTTWLTFTGGNFKRDIVEHHAHRHNHQHFHRRNRIIKSSARA